MNAQLQTIPQPEPNDSANLLAVISRAATDPTVDVSKMERMWAMYERMQALQSAQDYAKAMSDTQSEIPKIIKDRTNTQTSSDYATLDAINKAVIPIYTRHGLSLSFDTEDSTLPDHVRIVCHVSHTGGHVKTFRYDNPMDSAGIAGKVNKTPTHARGSAITYGRRYLEQMIFNIVTGADDDGNGAHGDRITEAQAATLQDLIDATGSNKVKFLEWLKVASLDAIPAKAYDSALKALQARERK